MKTTWGYDGFKKELARRAATGFCHEKTTQEELTIYNTSINRIFLYVYGKIFTKPTRFTHRDLHIPRDDGPSTLALRPPHSMSEQRSTTILLTLSD